MINDIAGVPELVLYITRGDESFASPHCEDLVSDGGFQFAGEDKKCFVLGCRFPTAINPKPELFIFPLIVVPLTAISPTSLPFFISVRFVYSTRELIGPDGRSHHSRRPRAVWRVVR